MSDPHTFRTPPAEAMVAVGAVGSRSARLWLRAPEPGGVRVRWQEEEGGVGGERALEVPDGPRDRTASVEVPGPECAPLRPRTRYGFRVVAAGGAVVGEGRFETAPAGTADAPDAFSLAVMSCHQPFDAQGRATPGAREMLRPVRRVLADRNARCALAVGDQVYVDYPPRLSLLDPGHFRRVAPPGRARLQDCSAAEVRALVQRRYRIFWNVPEWRALHAELPVLPMLDDHEIVDNWGSDPAHATPAWRGVGEGARAAYLDYQGSRVAPGADVPPPCFDWKLEYGPLAVYALDLRSHRRVGIEARIFSDAQHAALEDFLRAQGERDVVALVLSVPLVHLPRWAATLAAGVTRHGEDFSDRWSTAGHRRDRDRILHLLHRHQRRHPHQRLLLLSGDIHIGCVHEVRWRDGTGVLHQLVSSGITHGVGRLVAGGSKLSIAANRRVRTSDGRAGSVRPLRGVSGRRKNPYGGRNLGLVELRRRPDGRFDVAFSLHGHRGDAPREVYRSPWLPPPGAA